MGARFEREGAPRFEGKVAVVTGAARGLGFGIAQRFHAEGASVAMLDINFDDTVTASAQLGPRAVPMALDIRSDVSVDAAVAEIVASLGVPDVWVNNAGRTAMTPLWDVTLPDFDDVLAVNLRGTFLASRAVAEVMRQRGGGRIVNLASIAGQSAGALSSPAYAASKAGIVALTRVFAYELAGAGITVNAIAPGVIDSPLLRALPQDVQKSARESIPLGRFGTVEEIAGLVAYLASDEGGYTTGATFDINGGLLMR